MGDDRSWVIAAAHPGGAVRFALPRQSELWQGEAWIEVRALSHREALERESVGLVEAYDLDETGRVVEVTRECDLWAMAAYDYAHSLVDFSLPELQDDGTVRIRRMDEVPRDEVPAFLGQMPEALGRWVDEQIDCVNLRDVSGQEALALAKKKSEP